MWSCILWMVRDRRRYAMMSSPFMVAYGNLIIVLQYFWSFERAKPVAGFFVEKENPFHSLSSKVVMIILCIRRLFFFLSKFIFVKKRSQWLSVVLRGDSVLTCFGTALGPQRLQQLKLAYSAFMQFF